MLAPSHTVSLRTVPRTGVSVPESVPDIVVLDRPIEPEDLRVLVERMEVEDEDVRDRIRELTFRLVGRGESLS